MKEELFHKNYRKLVILLMDMEESAHFEEDAFEETAAKPLYKIDPDHLCSVSSPGIPVW